MFFFSIIYSTLNANDSPPVIAPLLLYHSSAFLPALVSTTLRHFRSLSLSFSPFFPLLLLSSPVFPSLFHLLAHSPCLSLCSHQPNNSLWVSFSHPHVQSSHVRVESGTRYYLLPFRFTFILVSFVHIWAGVCRSKRHLHPSIEKTTSCCLVTYSTVAREILVFKFQSGPITVQVWPAFLSFFDFSFFVLARSARYRTNDRRRKKEGA